MSAGLGTVISLEGRLRAKLAGWRELLQRNVSKGRAVLWALLIGPPKFTPIREARRRGYQCEGKIALDRLLSGVVELPTVMASPNGIEDSCTLVGSALKA